MLCQFFKKKIHIRDLYKIRTKWRKNWWLIGQQICAVIINVPLSDRCALANFWSWRPWNGILNLLLTRFKLNKSKVSVDCDFHKLATNQEMLKLLGMRAHWSTNNKTKKSFSPIGCVMYGKSYRFVKILCLPYYCLMTAWWLADTCKLPIIIVNQKSTVLNWETRKHTPGWWGH